MLFKRIILIIPFIAVTLNYSCSDQTTNTDTTQNTETNDLITKIQKAVDNYFTIKDEEKFIKSTYTGTYSEPIIGQVYEFVITQTATEMPEFNYMVIVSYNESSESINIVRYDFYILTNEKDIGGWIEKRLKLNEAKKVK